MNAIELLDKAANHMRDRAATYDKPEGERSMRAATVAFNAITGRNLTEAEGWLLLQVLKDVRQWQRPERYHADSAEDCIAYAALKAEALAVAGQPPLVDENSLMWVEWADPDLSEGVPNKPSAHRMVEVKFRDRSTCVGPASDFDWFLRHKDTDIVRYRFL